MGANTALNWLLLSSANPAEASLTFKGILVSFIPLAMAAFGATHVAVSQDTLSGLINTTTLVVQDGLLVIAAWMTFYGALRKLFLGLMSFYRGIAA